MGKEKLLRDIETAKEILSVRVETEKSVLSDWRDVVNKFVEDNSFTLDGIDYIDINGESYIICENDLTIFRGVLENTFPEDRGIFSIIYTEMLYDDVAVISSCSATEMGNTIKMLESYERELSYVEVLCEVDKVVFQSIHYTLTGAYDSLYTTAEELLEERLLQFKTHRTHAIFDGMMLIKEECLSEYLKVRDRVEEEDKRCSSLYIRDRDYIGTSTDKFYFDLTLPSLILVAIIIFTIIMLSA